MKIIFQISTMMHETWMGIENYQTMIVLCAHYSMHSPNRNEKMRVHKEWCSEMSLLQQVWKKKC